MFGWSVGMNKTTNEKEYEYNAKKDYADRYAESLETMRNEKDPVKQQKMNMRLAMGITDFSDL